MFPAEVPQEIKDLNIAYVLLAQKLLRHDRAAGMLWLGVSAEAADFLLGLSSAQILRISAGSAPLCGFRLDGQMPAVLGTEHAGHVQQAHLFIVLASHDNRPRHRQSQQEIPE